MFGTLERHVDPADVAAAACFLCTDGGRNITGVEIPVDAGQLLGGGRSDPRPAPCGSAPQNGMSLSPGGGMSSGGPASKPSFAPALAPIRWIVQTSRFVK